MKKITTILAILFLGSFLMVGSASALSLDFGVIAPSTGLISYAGGNNPLIATNVSVDNVVGLDTSANNVIPLNIINGKLSFTTGALTSAWNWGGGVNTIITLTGAVDANNDGDLFDAGDLSDRILMSGSFGSASVAYFGNSFYISGGAFNDQKDIDLLNLFEMPIYFPNTTTLLPYVGNFNISFDAAFTQTGAAFTSTRINSGDIVNSPVPEPATMMLLGMGLLGLGAIGRKKLKK
ncbi:MAG: PEP-CTERM sorting domain-containing protein [Desulfobacterium sp.]|nr:PEP-CTERM sorting domain-containing protein [Desulfobacterium sp.]